MTVYLDTSVVCSALLPDAHTTSVHRWLDQNGSAGLAASAWVEAELEALLARKVSAGFLDDHDHRETLHIYRTAVQPSLRYAAVDDHILIGAGFLARRCRGKLRAPDAVHLSVALSFGFVVVTADKGMVQAGTALDIPSVYIGHPALQ